MHPMPNPGMTDSTSSSSALSCTTCKVKKVRCSRGLPSCDRCKAHGIECNYPERAKRKPRKGAASRLLASNSPLSVILERLEKVEQQVTGLHNSPGGQDIQSDASGIDEASSQRKAWLLQGGLADDIGSASSPSSSITASTPGTETIGPRAFEPGRSFPDVDITDLLTNAISQVQRSRLQGITKSAVTDGISLPTELVRKWIHNYFAHVRTEAFIDLVDSKLIHVIPDIIDMPHVHIDAAILVIYYSILFRGCSLPTNLVDASDAKFARQAYLCCLRTLPNWQREATGTLTDFVAAIFTSRSAAECFDYELGWQMYKLACEYAIGLNMHNLDDGNGPSESNQSNVDSDRRGFWELIQIDYFFRLLYDKPPALTSSLSSWRVNFPWLSPDSQPDMHAIPTMTFLVSSRITLTLIHFFQLLEEGLGGADVLPKVNKLCDEIEHLFRDWQLEDWLQQSRDNDIHCWMIIDVLMTGYTCVLFMLRRFSALDSSSPPPLHSGSHFRASTLAINASRKILDIIDHLLAKFPITETMSMMVGLFQAFIPYGYVANNILRSSSPGVLSPDLELLERVAGRIIVLSQEEADLKPLARALQRSNNEVRQWINTSRTKD
ncbi:hypothetical protein ACJZ2D_005297 [Fusarium nematophilum]